MCDCRCLDPCEDWMWDCVQRRKEGVSTLHWHNCEFKHQRPNVRIWVVGVGNPLQECHWVELELRWNHAITLSRQAWIIKLLRSILFSAACCGFTLKPRKVMWSLELKLEHKPKLRSVGIQLEMSSCWNRTACDFWTNSCAALSS